MNKKYIEWVKSDYDIEKQDIEYVKIEGEHLRIFPLEITRLTRLLELHIPYHNLKTIPIEIKNLKILRKLILNNNKFDRMPVNICSLKNLIELDLRENNISKVPKYIKNLKKLKILILSKNELEIIPFEISYLTNLKELYIDQNNISILPLELFNLINLTCLDTSINNIISIPHEIIKLHLLEFFSCEYNNINILPIELVYLPLTIQVSISNNPFTFLQPQIINRFIDKHIIIYNDSESVHNKSIQKSLIESINYLTSRSLINNDIQELIKNDFILTNKTKEIIQEYCNNNELHSILKLSFKQLLFHVYDFILEHAMKNDILNILNIEILESENLCFIRRFTCLINTLIGYDENIKLNISENEDISNIIIVSRNYLLKNNEYNVENHKNLVIKELQQRQYNIETINVWIEYI
jgi:hypothetical protein